MKVQLVLGKSEDHSWDRSTSNSGGIDLSNRSGKGKGKGGKGKKGKEGGESSPWKGGKDMQGKYHDVALRVKVQFDKDGNPKATVKHGGDAVAATKGGGKHEGGKWGWMKGKEEKGGGNIKNRMGEDKDMQSGHPAWGWEEGGGGAAWEWEEGSDPASWGWGTGEPEYYYYGDYDEGAGRKAGKNKGKNKIGKKAEAKAEAHASTKHGSSAKEGSMWGWDDDGDDEDAGGAWGWEMGEAEGEAEDEGEGGGAKDMGKQSTWRWNMGG